MATQGAGQEAFQMPAKIVLVCDPILGRMGRKLGERMEVYGYTDETLAEELGVDPLTVWRWRNGRREPRRQFKLAMNRLMPGMDDMFASVGA